MNKKRISLAVMVILTGAYLFLLFGTELIRVDWFNYISEHSWFVFMLLLHVPLFAVVAIMCAADELLTGHDNVLWAMLFGQVIIISQTVTASQFGVNGFVMYLAGVIVFLIGFLATEFFIGIIIGIAESGKDDENAEANQEYGAPQSTPQANTPQADTLQSDAQLADTQQTDVPPTDTPQANTPEVKLLPLSDSDRQEFAELICPNCGQGDPSVQRYKMDTGKTSIINVLLFFIPFFGAWLEVSEEATTATCEKCLYSWDVKKRKMKLN